MALASVAACGPQVPTPTPPVGLATEDRHLASVPRPGLATDLGQSGLGVDGSGGFLSFASDLSPASTMSAYADQLTLAGFHETGRQGAWRVFSDQALTLWVRVGSGGPPTSLIVRAAPTTPTVADLPVDHPILSAEIVADGPDRAEGVRQAGPKASSPPTVGTRQPDPPHAAPRSEAVGTTGGAPAAGGPAIASGDGAGASPSPGGGAGGPAVGTGSGVSGGGGSRP